LYCFLVMRLCRVSCCLSYIFLSHSFFSTFIFLSLTPSNTLPLGPMTPPRQVASVASIFCSYVGPLLPLPSRPPFFPHPCFCVDEGIHTPLLFPPPPRCLHPLLSNNKPLACYRVGLLSNDLLPAPPLSYFNPLPVLPPSL